MSDIRSAVYVCSRMDLAVRTACVFCRALEDQGIVFYRPLRDEVRFLGKRVKFTSGSSLIDPGLSGTHAVYDY